MLYQHQKHLEDFLNYGFPLYKVKQVLVLSLFFTASFVTSILFNFKSECLLDVEVANGPLKVKITSPLFCIHVGLLSPAFLHSSFILTVPLSGLSIKPLRETTWGITD